VEGLRHADQVQGGAVPNAALNATYVAPPDLRNIGKCFLREALLLPQFTNSQYETPEGGMSGSLTRLARHASDAGVLHLSDHARSDTTIYNARS
jgi:hypothetical protein